MQKIHPLILSTNLLPSDMMMPFYAIQPFSIHQEKERICKILDDSLTDNLNIILGNFPSLDHAYITISISGWLLKQNSLSQMQNNMKKAFVWAIWSYLNDNPAERNTFIKSVFGEKVIEKDYLVIPLESITKSIPFSNDNYIQDRQLFIPPHVYMDKIPEAIESSLDFIIESFETNIQTPIKKEIKDVFHDKIESIKKTGNENGPWLLYKSNIDPLLKFAVDLLRKPKERQVYSIIDIHDCIAQYIPKHNWDLQFRDYLLSLDEGALLQVYKKAYMTKKISELEYVSSHSISIKENTKLCLSTLDDIDKLRAFPCIEKILESKTISHNLIAALFSILLWFYTKKECHTILKKKLNIPNYNVEKAERQINSLIDSDGYPRYIYGTKGFGEHCIGYSVCSGCWLTHINFPEKYYHKKRNLRNNYFNPPIKDEKTCSISPVTMTI